MYIFRWLMKHPIIILALYFLSIVAILLSMTGGGSSDKSTDIAKSAEAQKADSTEVDLSEAPAIEPSTLTSALVEGEPTKSEEVVKAEVSATTETKDDSAAAYFKEHGVDPSLNAPAAAIEEKQEPVAETEETTTEVKEETKVIATDVAKEVEQSSEETKVEEVVKAEVAAATETKDDSAAAYFKEHGVDPSLNAPVTAIEEKQEPVAETESQEQTTEVAKVAATDSTATPENETTETDDTQFSEMNADELLLMAREAYWNNGLEESAQIYQQLISSSPDVLDYKGELGNVYWRQGYPKKAAELYAEISMPMIEAGDTDKVANMVGFIGLFYPEKATEIHNKLQAGK